MKKTSYIIILSVLVIVTFFSCVEQEFLSSGSVKVVGNIDVNAEQDGTRVTYVVGSSSISTEWQTGDVIALMSEDEPSPLLYSADGSGKTTTFYATGTEVSGEGEEYYAWYPYQSDDMEGYPYAQLPNLYEQPYVGESLVNKYDVIYGRGTIDSNTLNISFSHLFAFLKLTIPTDSLKGANGIYIYSNEYISCTSINRYLSYYDLSRDTIVGTKNKVLYSYIASNYLTQETLTMYIAMLPTSENNVLSIYRRESGGSRGDGLLVKKAPEGGFKAGHVYSVNVDEEESYEAILAKERAALIALYKATDGANWTNNENWCTDASIDTWYGITTSRDLVTQISLYSNNLCGKLPIEIGDLSCLKSLNLRDNEISGELPAEIGNLSCLTTLNLNDNQLSGDIPTEICNLTNLTLLNLGINNFTGAIPDNIDCLSNLRYFYAYENNLTGEIPACIGQLSSLKYLHLYSNGLTGEIPSGIGYLTQLEQLRLRDNNLTGNLPTSMASLSTLTYINLTENRLSGTIPDEIINCDWFGRLGYENIIGQQRGYVLKLPYALHDWTVHTLQEHTKGSGIVFLIMGEAYTQAFIDDGTYEKHAGWAYEALFSEEPLTSFKDYFDVYYVDIPSEDATLGGNTAFGITVSDSKYVFDADLTKSYVCKLEETGYSQDGVISIIMVRAQGVRSICRIGSTYAQAYCFCYKETDFKQVVHHEACGHGLGKLADEYTESDAMPSGYGQTIAKLHEENRYLNVDTVSTASDVIWSHFLSDSRYDNEQLGLFEGGATYSTGVYRSRETSIMRYNTGGFNAPSRQSIYYHIMNLAGESYSFDDFLEYDEINRKTFSSSAAKASARSYTGPLGAPPIFE